MRGVTPGIRPALCPVSMAPPQVAPPVVRPLPPGQALYRHNESMHAAQMEWERTLLIAPKKKVHVDLEEAALITEGCRLNATCQWHAGHTTITTQRQQMAVGGIRAVRCGARLRCAPGAGIAS